MANKSSPAKHLRIDPERLLHNAKAINRSAGEMVLLAREIQKRAARMLDATRQGRKLVYQKECNELDSEGLLMEGDSSYIDRVLRWGRFRSLGIDPG